MDHRDVAIDVEPRAALRCAASDARPRLQSFHEGLGEVLRLGGTRLAVHGIMGSWVDRSEWMTQWTLKDDTEHHSVSQLADYMDSQLADFGDGWKL